MYNISKTRKRSNAQFTTNTIVYSHVLNSIFTIRLSRFGPGEPTPNLTQLAKGLHLLVRNPYDSFRLGLCCLPSFLDGMTTGSGSRST